MKHANTVGKPLSYRSYSPGTLRLAKIGANRTGDKTHSEQDAAHDKIRHDMVRAGRHNHGYTDRTTHYRDRLEYFSAITGRATAEIAGQEEDKRRNLAAAMNERQEREAQGWTFLNNLADDPAYHPRTADERSAAVGSLVSDTISEDAWQGRVAVRRRVVGTLLTGLAVAGAISLANYTHDHRTGVQRPPAITHTHHPNGQGQ